jgi:hypothetical protein
MEQNNATLRQLHAERLARRGVAIEEIKVIEEIIPEVNEKKEEEDCPVCLSPMETKHNLHCGHVICGDCPAIMMTQTYGNGCVGQHAESGIKVIKCPICRKCDMPTREQLIAELVRIRLGGRFSLIAPAPAPAPAPAVIPVRIPVIQIYRHPAIGNIQDGNWLGSRNFQPISVTARTINHLPDYYPVQPNMPQDISLWNILSGHPLETVSEVGQFLNAGQRVDDGFICGVAGTRRFYHDQYFIPYCTVRSGVSRRYCNNTVCLRNHRSKTERRCTRGCGQFICQACFRCNHNECQRAV